MAKLRRVLGLFELTLIGVGIILGAGVYTLIGKAAGVAGNSVWLSFFIAAVVAAFTGLSYAELSSMFPKAGAEYVYVKESIGKRVAWLTSWILIFAGILAGATVSLGFAGYLNVLTNLPIMTGALLLVVAISAINFWGIKQSATMAIIFSIIEVFGLVFIVFVGIPYFGSVDYFEITSIGSIFSGAALLFFAFLGFEELVRLSEETKGSRKIMPKALVLAVLISTVLYVLVSIAAISVVDASVLSASNSPLADVASAAIGRNSSLVLSIIALFATFNTALLILLATSRISYGMAMDKSLPRAFAKLYPKTRTPWMSILAIGALSSLFVFVGRIEALGYLTDMLVFAAFIVVNASLIVLRYKKPKLRRAFKVPVSIGRMPLLPLLGIVTSAILMLNVGADVMVYGIGILALGVAVYLAYFKKF